MKKKQILLTNDDGILSPGLWAAAEALSKLGFVTVAAPREQSSGTGRSLPGSSDGIIQKEQVTVHDQNWEVYAVGGTPAQAVLHAVLEIMPEKPDLVVSGINYGENVATGVTISGTVGAAMEAVSLGIPALALSLETDQKHHLSYSREVDFSAASHFAFLFAKALIEKNMPDDVMLLKIDVPSDASVGTTWRITRLSKNRYYEPVRPNRESWDVPGAVGYRLTDNLNLEPSDTDVYALRVDKVVSVTPLSLDLTSRTDFETLDILLRK